MYSKQTSLSLINKGRCPHFIHSRVWTEREIVSFEVSYDPFPSHDIIVRILCAVANRSEQFSTGGKPYDSFWPCSIETFGTKLGN